MWFSILSQKTSSSKRETFIQGNVNAGGSQGSILGPLLFLITLTIYQMECLLLVNFLPRIHLFFQWLKTSNQAQLPYAVT